jgi:hypothetical protein
MLRYPDPKQSFSLEPVAFVGSILLLISGFVTPKVR